MKFTFHTSLIALIFAVGVTDTFAAPAVRQLGGGFTGPGSESTSANVVPSGGTITKPSGITSSRAGSIRSTPRPTATSNGSASVATVSSGTADTNRSASTQQRLSIGSYIGAPRQISSGGGGDTTEITNDIKNINNEIQNITNIVEGLGTDISGKVDKEQGINEAGKALVVGSDGFVTTSEFVTPGELEVDLNGKVDKDQGVGAAGKALLVNADGIVTTGDVLKPGDVDLSGKVDVLQGRQYKGKALVVDNDGKLKPIGEIPDAVDINGKVDIFQGPEHAGNALIVDQYGNVQPTGDFVETDQGVGAAGKALMVNNEGKVVPSAVDIGQVTVDLNGKVDKDQGVNAAGHVLSVNSEGKVTNENEVYFKPEMDTKLSQKLNNTADPELYSGRALVVNADGDIVPTGDFVETDQGVEYAQRVLTVDNAGHVKPDKIVYSVSETDALLNAKLNNTADAEEHGGKALIVDPETGEIRPGDIDFSGLEVDLSGKVDKLQGDEHVNEVLVVGSDGKVTDQKIVNANVADNAALERAKMAADITDTLDWVDAWKNQAGGDPTSEDPANPYKLDLGTRYVMALDEYGQKAWFRVVVDE